MAVRCSYTHPSPGGSTTMPHGHTYDHPTSQATSCLLPHTGLSVLSIGGTPRRFETHANCPTTPEALRRAGLTTVGCLHNPTQCSVIWHMCTRYAFSGECEVWGLCTAAVPMPPSVVHCCTMGGCIMQGAYATPATLCVKLRTGTCCQPHASGLESQAGRATHKRRQQ